MRNLHPLEVVPRYRDPYLQVGGNLNKKAPIHPTVFSLTGCVKSEYNENHKTKNYKVLFYIGSDIYIYVFVCFGNTIGQQFSTIF